MGIANENRHRTESFWNGNVDKPCKNCMQPQPPAELNQHAFFVPEVSGDIFPLENHTKEDLSYKKVTELHTWPADLLRPEENVWGDGF